MTDKEPVFVLIRKKDGANPVSIVRMLVMVMMLSGTLTCKVVAVKMINTDTIAKKTKSASGDAEKIQKRIQNMLYGMALDVSVEKRRNTWENHSIWNGIESCRGVGIQMSNQSIAQKELTQTEADVYLVKVLVSEVFHLTKNATKANSSMITKNRKPKKNYVFVQLPILSGVFLDIVLTTMVIDQFQMENAQDQLLRSVKIAIALILDSLVNT